MTDRELLEMAAKAIGAEVSTRDEDRIEGREELDIFFLRTGSDSWKEWNPLHDDGDALRLALSLNMAIKCNIYSCTVTSIHGLTFFEVYSGDGHGRNTAAGAIPAVRRAIVSSAAEIGKALP